VTARFKPFWPILVLSTASIGFMSCGKDPVRGSDNSGQDGVRKDQYPWAAFDVVKGLERGTAMSLSINRQGADVRQVSVVFESTYEYKYQRLILCRTPEDVPIGAGDSGSPLSLGDGRIAGLLCYGFDGNSHQFAARAIEDVMSVTDSEAGQDLAKNESSLFKPILPVAFSSGIDPAYIRRMEAADRSGFFERLAGAKSIGKASRLAKRSSAQAVSIIPGMPIAVLEMSGDLVDMGAIGALGIIDSDKMYAFGHSYSPYPTPLAAPALLANTATFIESGFTGFKYAAPTQDTIGAFTGQSGYGILIREGMRPETFPAAVSVQFNDTLPTVYSHRIVNTQSVAYEKFLGAFAASYAVYAHLPSFLDSDSLFAQCNVHIVFESGILDTTFQLDGTAAIDGELLEFIDQKLQVDDTGPHVVDFQADIRLFKTRDDLNRNNP
jgi:hypothetical protein